MKKFAKVIIILTIVATLLVSVGLLSACNKNSEKTIKVSASTSPHAEILNGIVKQILADQGYDLVVKEVNWNIPNGSVANGDMDANYFQHLPYLLSDEEAPGLAFSCTVHYEPLGVYYGGHATAGQKVTEGKSFEICEDESNAVRALQLLEYLGVFSKETEGTNYPITNEGKLNFTGNSWTSTSNVVIKRIAEEYLVSGLDDFDFACLPCNTALTGHVDLSLQVAIESDPALVSGRANGLAVRKADYLNNSVYKAKIDALTNALLSKEVADFIKEKYNGFILCNSETQIDMRGEIK
ncbi:MAG: hypothetical protein IJ226_03560 [Clostridia bacterium]|nr:hypothetical protein [Clostridia bacterium]